MIYVIGGHALRAGAVGIGGVLERDLIVDFMKRFEKALHLKGVTECKFNYKSELFRHFNGDFDDGLNLDLMSLSSSDLVVEVHFNAFSSRSANGCEVLASGEGFRFVSDAVSRGFSFNNRGLKSGNHLLTIRKMRDLNINHVILEVCFCTSTNDMANYYALCDESDSYIPLINSLVEYGFCNAPTKDVWYSHLFDDFEGLGVINSGHRVKADSSFSRAEVLQILSNLKNVGYFNE